jgi:hypothetical protein
MKEMNKEFTYKGYTFNFCIELNVEIERCPDGKRFHKVTVNDMGSTNYNETTLVDNDQLALDLIAVEQSVKEWVDKRENVDPLLNQLQLFGFK